MVRQIPFKSQQTKNEYCLCARCTAGSNNTQRLEFGAEKGLVQSPARGMSGSCPKNPKLPESFQLKPFIAKVREGRG